MSIQDTVASATQPLPRESSSSGETSTKGVNWRRLIKNILRIIIFPWLIWSIIAAVPKYLRKKHLDSTRLGRLATYVVQAGVYLTIGLPLTVFLTGELLTAPNVDSVKTSLVIRCAKDQPGVPFDILEERLNRSA